LFVGEDVAERAHAAAAGLQVCPHPLLSESIIEAVIADEARPVDQARRADVILRYVRISSDGAALPWSSLAVLALSPFDWVDIVDTVDFHWRLLPNLLYPNRPMPNSITNQDGNQCSGPRKMPD